MLKLIQFSGEIPRLLPRLLPDTAAQHAENVRLDDGGLTPIRQLKHVHTITGVDPVVSIYKHGSDWLAFSAKVDAAPGPVAQDRLYYTGDGAPKMRVSGTVYNLAVPYPTGALTATLGGTGSGNVYTRLYVYTYVTDFGEESEPCPISNAIDWQSGKTVTLSGFATPPAGRAITKQRIYRSQTSVTAGTDLFLIAERAASNANFTDTVAVDDFAEVLPSRDWTAPPSTLKGLVSGPNGMMAAFSGKDVYFCEPFRPHAWPEKYVLTVDYNVVALGFIGSTLAILTEGLPYIAAGTAPENMQQEKLEKNFPCINARGVVDLGYGIAYPSKDGLVVIDPSGANLVTQALMAREKWLRTSPETFVAGQLSGRYYASYRYVDADDAVVSGTFIIDLTGAAPFLMRSGDRADAMHYSITDSALYLAIGSSIYEFDAAGEVASIMTWRSKQFVAPAPTNFGCILIEGSGLLTAEQQAALDAERAAIEANNAAVFPLASIGGELNGAALNAYAANDDELERLYSPTFCSVIVIADGEQVAVVTELNKVKRLPGGFKASLWEVVVTGTAAIEQISLALTPRELNVA